MSLHAEQTAQNSSAPETNPGQEPPFQITQYLRSRGLAAWSNEDASLLRHLLELPARLSERRVSVGRAAQSLHVSRRTLARRCRRAGLPPPVRILAIGRVLHAVRVMRETGWSVAKVAAMTGWPDPFTLSNSMHALTGLRPSKARRRGPICVAEAWLRHEVEAGAAELREPRPPHCPSCGQQVRLAEGG